MIKLKVNTAMVIFMSLRFQLISGCHFLSLGIIVRFELLSIIYLKPERKMKKDKKRNSTHHLLNVLLRKPALVVGDGDLVLVAGTLVACRHIQHSVGVNLKSHLQDTW